MARIAALEQSVLSARTALEATTLGRDVGSRTELDVLDAQQRLFTAQLDLAQARSDYLLGRVRLASAAGELEVSDLRALNVYLSQLKADGDTNEPCGFRCTGRRCRSHRTDAGHQLARRGVRALIIDRHAGPSRETRALGVQARTLEIYARLGVVDRALELGKPGTGANMWADGRKMARVPLGDAGKQLTPYPYILVLGQDDNERILGQRLTDFGLAVQWNCELVGFEQASDHVRATLRQGDGSTRSVTAAWVAGCDGARSVVREQSGIGFPGAPYEHVFFVADVEMTGPMVPDELNVYLWQSGFHLLFPMRGQDHWRIVGILPPPLRRDGVGFEELLPEIRDEVGSALDIRHCTWFSTYRIHHRAAARFRDRRCFLLGDAAHIHSPVGAQGMNTGLQDAYNLAWKLALVVHGKADAALRGGANPGGAAPAGHHRQGVPAGGFRQPARRPAAHPRAGAHRGAAHEPPQRAGAAFRTVSQLAIHYRDSALSAPQERGWPEAAPQAGDRFPWLQLRFEDNGPACDLFDRLDDTRFNLLVFGQSLPAEAAPDFGDLLRVHVIATDAANDAQLQRAKIPPPSFYLLRPDGYVGLCGHGLDAAAVARYAARLGIASPRSTAGRATNAASTRFTFAKSSKPTKAPAS